MEKKVARVSQLILISGSFNDIKAQERTDLLTGAMPAIETPFLFGAGMKVEQLENED